MLGVMTLIAGPPPSRRGLVTISVFHILTEEDGYFYNTPPIHGMSKLSLSFKTEGLSFRLFWSGDLSFDDDRSVNYTSSSVITSDFDGHLPTYFKIENTSGAKLNISEINIEFTCLNNYPMFGVHSEDDSKGSVSGDSGAIRSGTNVTISAVRKTGYCFGGWIDGEGNLISSNNPYTFAMPSFDYDLTATFITEEEAWNIAHGVTPTISEDGKTITYGLYPQTNVDDSSLIAVLDALDTPESNGWYLYNDDYYAKVIATPDNYKCTFDDGMTIVSGTTYWFKCEPITWNVLSNNDGEYYILSTLALDAHCYYHSSSDFRTIDEETISPNNYEYSDIRAWLNNYFYNSAFALGNGHIQTTIVDNSAETTWTSDNEYACGNTEDKVFLPSNKDYNNSDYGFVDNASRCSKTTEWARARGAEYSTNASYLYNSSYWSRSPDFSYANIAWLVSYDGYPNHHYALVDGTSCGVRPALMIEL